MPEQASVDVQPTLTKASGFGKCLPRMYSSFYQKLVSRMKKTTLTAPVYAKILSFRPPLALRKTHLNPSLPRGSRTFAQVGSLPKITQPNQKSPYRSVNLSQG